jgi:gp16 family phage-associated protein
MDDVPHPNEANAPLQVSDFRAQGISVAHWARLQGFNPRLVYQVLSGRRKSLRGQSFRIARALGMK